MAVPKEPAPTTVARLGCCRGLAMRGTLPAAGGRRHQGPSAPAAGIRTVDEVASYERRFRRAGLPLLKEGHTAAADAFTRAAPLLALVFIGETLGAIQLDWPLAANVAAALGGLAILLGAFGVVNRLRRRSFWSLPEEVGTPELVAFVLVPAALPVIFGGQTTSALVTALANVALLALAYLWFGYGLPWMLRWAALRLFSQLATSLGLLSRAVPLLLVFSLVLFVNTEMWQVFAALGWGLFGVACGLFALVASAFLAFRLPREVELIERDAGGGQAPLNTRQRVNVGLVMLVSQGLQVLVVVASVGLFFVVFGALAIGPEVRESWIGDQGERIGLTLELFGERLAVTEELLRVSGGIAAFSGLYYSIAVLTDATYREEFLDELTAELRSTFRLRAEYLTLRARVGAE